mmetsp:Transcript_4502/g.6766  ORF Transcript_4502/g.6766 Transcript_4502/m.6766 type:complete len:198 (+) Transcript_4502:1402-1995(+)
MSSQSNSHLLHPAQDFSNYKSIAEEDELTKNILSHRSHNSNLHYQTEEQFDQMKGPRASSQEQAQGRNTANPDCRDNPKLQLIRPTLNISELGRPGKESTGLIRSVKMMNDGSTSKPMRNIPEPQFGSVVSNTFVSSSKSQKIHFKSRDSATNLTWMKGSKGKEGESSAKNSTHKTGTKGMTYTSGQSNQSATKNYN